MNEDSRVELKYQPSVMQQQTKYKKNVFVTKLCVLHLSWVNPTFSKQVNKGRLKIKNEPNSSVPVCWWSSYTQDMCVEVQLQANAKLAASSLNQLGFRVIGHMTWKL